MRCARLCCPLLNSITNPVISITMTERHSKTTFSAEELRRIVELVRELETATASKQKSIRAKLRSIGLYWSEVASGMDYTVANLKTLFEIGTLTVKELSTDIFFVWNNIAPIRSSVNLDKMKDSEMSQENTVSKGRTASDEHYVIDLCDEILGYKALRQHRFDFLRGDNGTRLPVDAYYHELKIVVEYYESQHTESTPFFDNKKTVSGVSRGEQRRIYDQRRKEVLPENGIKLIVISYIDFGGTKKLVRNHDRDLKVIKEILKKNGLQLK